MNILILDSGNSIIKGKIVRRENGEAAYPHALKTLTEAEYAEYEKENCVYSDTFSSRVLRPAEIQQHYRFIRGILGDFAK